MIIMLARTKKPVPLYEKGPSWALEGGNSPEILQGVLALLTKAVKASQSSETSEREIAKKLIQNWRYEVQRIAKETVPNKDWDATFVDFYHVPREAIKMRIFRSFDCQEVCAYWLEGDSVIEYRIAEKIDIEEISKYL